MTREGYDIDALNNKWLKFCSLRCNLEQLTFHGNMRFFSLNDIIKTIYLFRCYRKGKLERKKKIYIKRLTYLASLEVCYQCYKIIEHLISCSFLNCFCDRYDGCLRSEYASKDYCIVCRTYASYDLEKLKDIKRNSFNLEKFYLNMLRDLR